ncbi:MAG: type II secretion system protein, partial [Candidatus Omnitrophica bacterium]|nr:type II secretion system protein [Candidatus Omnitrophota bacterium]
MNRMKEHSFMIIGNGVHRKSHAFTLIELLIVIA